MEFRIGGPAPPNCKHCGKAKNRHLAKTFNCMVGRGNFPFPVKQVYEPKAVHTKKVKPYA